MKTVIVTCDICGRPVAAGDVRYLEIDGHPPREIDAACLLATTDTHADPVLWESLRDAAVAKMKKERAADVVAVAAGADPVP